MNLHEASREGDLQEAKSAIQNIFNDIRDLTSRYHALGRKDVHSLTPLHYAVKYNSIDIVRLLIDKGADVNIKGKNDTTPLHYATRYMKPEDDASILQLLLHSKANVNAIDDFDSTPLHYACMRGNEKAVKELLKSKDIDVKAADKLHSTSVHSACSFGSTDIVELLVENDAEVLAENDAKMTPLHVACSQGHEKLVERLFDIIQEKHGLTAIPKVIEQQTLEGQSLLHLAVLGSHLNIAKLLLERGSNVNQCMDGDETVMHIAATTGNKEITKLLLAHGSEIDKKNDMGRTALHKAARFGKYRIVDMLIKQGADVNIRDNHRLTPIILASSSSGNSKTIQILLNNGANIELRDKEDQTALHVAVADNNVNGVQALLNSQHARDIINLKDKDNNSSLHAACAMGFEEIAILLMTANANVQSRNNFEKTPLHLAAFYGQDDVVDNIVDIKPSTINDFDREGNSPLHLAAENGHADVVKYLLKCGAAVNDKNTQSMTALDCAATNGQTEAVKVLLWGGASVQPSDESGLTPLHRSCTEGHVETIEVLLQQYYIGVTDANGRNALDLAIDNLNKDAAIALLNHRDWKVALRNKTIEDYKVTTPMRKMISRMPELATYTLDRCVEETDEYPNDHPEYSITVTYEFLDDIYQEWPCDIVRKDTDEGRGKGDLFTSAKIQKELEKKESHTFSYMVEHKQKELVGHPLSLSLLEFKWSKFASYLYYFKLILYTLFLTFVTGYVTVSAPLREPYRAADCTIVIENGTWDMIVFIKIGKWMVLLLAIIHLLFELLQMIGQMLDYIAFDNLLEWTVYLLAIANVIDDFIELPLTEQGLICGEYQKTTGAVCVFLAWVNFILFIRKVPVFGIYIVMFLYVISTFLKFFIVFIFLIMAFGFSFYILLHDVKSIPSFNGPLGALIKTGVMMTGELGFDDIFFNTDYKPEPVTWILFILFIVLMVIILMNLLVGLAVDDIQEVQKQAEMTKATMQIDICLDSEKTLPKMIRKNFIASEQVIFPNKKNGIPRNIGKDVLTEIRKLVRKEKEAIDQLQDSMKSLQGGMSKLDNRVEQMDDQLSEMSGMNEKMNELRTMMNEVLKYQQKRRSRRSAKPPDKYDGEHGDDEGDP